MMNKKAFNLRTTCLKKNFLKHAESLRCSNQDLVKEAVVDAPSHGQIGLPQSSTNLGEQQPATQNAEQKIVGEIPSKRLLEDGSQDLMPRKKKREILKAVRQRSNPLVGSLSVLPQIKVPVSQESKHITTKVLFLYVEAEQILDNVEREIDAFFEDEEEEDDEEEVKEKCCEKGSTFAVLSADDKDLVFKEIATSQEGREYKKFFNRNLSLCQQLSDGVELSNEYLATLRQAIKLLPAHPDYVPKLIAKFNKALLSYKMNPVHKQLKTVARNLVLVKMLVTKYHNKSKPPTLMRKIRPKVAG